MPGNYKRKDHLYKKAKGEGYRSRAAYKLIELDKKHSLIKPGFKVLDLGAWPGGWLQVLSRQVGPSGRVIGIDLDAIEDLGLANVETVVGDVSDNGLIARALEHLGGKADLIVSDMSPKLTGIREVDQAAATRCGEMVCDVAEQGLREGGHVVMKLFKGSDVEQFLRSIRSQFGKVHRAELDTTRKTSNEFYVVGLGFTGALGKEVT